MCVASSPRAGAGPGLSRAATPECRPTPTSQWETHSSVHLTQHFSPGTLPPLHAPVTLVPSRTCSAPRGLLILAVLAVTTAFQTNFLNTRLPQEVGIDPLWQELPIPLCSRNKSLPHHLGSQDLGSTAVDSCDVLAVSLAFCILMF